MPALILLLLITACRGHINFAFELGRLRSPSVAMQMKLHLK